MRLVSLAPIGAESIAVAPRIKAALWSTHPAAVKFAALTAAVARTATREVPVTTRCGMGTAPVSAGTIRTPPPTPTRDPNAPAANPRGAASATARALCAAVYASGACPNAREPRRPRSGTRGGTKGSFGGRRPGDDDADGGTDDDGVRGAVGANGGAPRRDEDAGSAATRRASRPTPDARMRARGRGVQDG